MAQTSIDWLIEKFELYYNGSMEFTYREIIEQAKEMHKEECENAWMDGFDFNSNYKDFEDYYNKTYNK